MAAAETLHGAVVYRERMALPRGSTVVVELVDVSRADAPAAVIASTSLTPRAGSPIPYTLDFDRAKIVPKRSYALQARISHDDRLLFINTTRHAVFAGGRDNTEILVNRASDKAGLDPTSAVGQWLAEDIRGGGVIDNLQSILEVAPDGRISGSSGCNRIMGQAKIDGANIAFGSIASTRMACPPAVMDQERKFLDALGAARSFKIHPLERKLVLLDGNGQMVMRLASMQ